MSDRVLSLTVDILEQWKKKLIDYAGPDLRAMCIVRTSIAVPVTEPEPEPTNTYAKLQQDIMNDIEMSGGGDEAHPLEMYKCHPIRMDYAIEAKTCYQPDELVEIAKHFNIRQGDIDDAMLLRNDIERAKQLLKMIQAVAGDDQVSWHKYTRVKPIDKIYRPEKEPHPMDWLYNLEMDKSLKQYMDVYPEYHAFKCSFMDTCDQQITEESIKKLINKGKKVFSIIINTAKHNESGKHWVALFVDYERKPPMIAYYNSNGQTNLNQYIKSLIDIFEKCSISPVEQKQKHTCPEQHQFGNSQCGVHAMHFIITMLINRDYSFKEYCEIHDHGDDLMDKLRDDVFFRRA